MMLSLGTFIFESTELGFQSIKRSTQQRWAKSNRTGQRAAHQHLGAGDDIKTLPGTLYAEISENGAVSLEVLRIMADQGKPYIMVDGSGFVHGEWIILSIEDERKHLFDNGAAQKIKFTIKLERYADNEDSSINTALGAVINGISV